MFILYPREWHSWLHVLLLSSHKTALTRHAKLVKDITFSRSQRLSLSEAMPVDRRCTQHTFAQITHHFLPFLGRVSQITSRLPSVCRRGSRCGQYSPEQCSRLGLAPYGHLQMLQGKKGKIIVGKQARKQTADCL